MAFDTKNYLSGHLILCSLMSGLLYPIVAHWVWDKKVSNYLRNIYFVFFEKTFAFSIFLWQDLQQICTLRENI
jgi:ammonia channel protein AmtB